MVPSLHALLGSALKGFTMLFSNSVSCVTFSFPFKALSSSEENRNSEITEKFSHEVVWNEGIFLRIKRANSHRDSNELLCQSCLYASVDSNIDFIGISYELSLLKCLKEPF